MRTSALISAAFVGGAISSPLVKRNPVLEMDTVYDVVYTTAYVTETAGATPVAEPTSSTSASSSSSALPDFHKAQKDWWSFGWTTSIVASASAEVEASVAPSAAITTSAAVTTSAAPVTTSSVAPVVVSTSSSVAPVVVSTSSVAVAPSSTSVTSASAVSTSSAVEVSFDSSDSLELLRRAGTPTCNPNNVRILTNYFPSPTAYCKRLQAAMPSPTNKIAPSLNLKQSNNICSCVLAGKYVSNTPLTSTKAATTSTKAATTKTSASTAKATTYQEKVLVHHNVHRANHSASDLTWSADLASTAQTIAESCVYAHNVDTNGGGYGQNIAAGVEPDNISEVITDLFYNGEVNYFNGLYGQANPDMSNFESWGHFSQIVWKGTTQVGCATVDCSSSGLSNTGTGVSPYFTVCNYKSPGNYAGEYADNIGASLGHASVSSTYDL